MKSKIYKGSDAPVLPRRIPRLNIPAKASVFSALSSVISKGSALLFTPFFTRLMPPEEYGSYSLFYSYLSTLMIFSTLEITGSVYFKASQKFAKERSALERKSLILIFFASSVTFLLFLALSRGTRLAKPFPYAFPLLFLSVISSAVINLRTAACKYSYKYKTPFFITLLQSIVSPALTLIILRLSVFEEAKALAKVGTATAVSVLIALPIIFNIMSGGYKRHSCAERGCERENFSANIQADACKTGETKAAARGSIPYLLKLSLPMLPYYISLLVISSSDRIIIGNTLGEGELGKYAVGYSAGIALGGVISAVCGALLPWITRRIERRDFGKIRHLCNTAEKIILGASLAFAAIGPEIIKILAPEGYLGALAPFYPAALSALPLFLITIHSCALVCYERSALIGLASAICASLCLALNIFFIPRLGVIFASIITLISYISLSLALALIFARVSGGSLIHAAKTVRNTLLAVTLGAALYQARNFAPVRLLACGAFAAYTLALLYKSRELAREEGESGMMNNE